MLAQPSRFGGASASPFRFRPNPLDNIFFEPCGDVRGHLDVLRKHAAAPYEFLARGESFFDLLS